MKTIVLYNSKYGSSTQYAAWIAEALHGDVKRAAEIQPAVLAAYDAVIYVGGIYASGVRGFKKFVPQLDALRGKAVVLCMVGMTDPAEVARYREYFEANVPAQYRDFVKPFALRGDQLFSKMNPLHRLLMQAPKAMVEKIPSEQRTEDNRYFLEHFGEDMHYIKRENIDAVVAYVQGLGG